MRVDTNDFRGESKIQKLKGLKKMLSIQGKFNRNETQANRNDSRSPKRNFSNIFFLWNRAGIGLLIVTDTIH